MCSGYDELYGSAGGQPALEPDPFMVIPVVLAESLVAEFYTTYYGGRAAGWKAWNHRLGIAAGVYFSLVVLYLLVNVIPGIHWKGWADQLAIVAYLLGIFPLGAIAFMNWESQGKISWTSSGPGISVLIGFLVVSHVAMVFGMVDPTITGWQPDAGADAPNGRDASYVKKTVKKWKSHFFTVCFCQQTVDRGVTQATPPFFIFPTLFPMPLPIPGRRQGSDR